MGFVFQAAAIANVTTKLTEQASEARETTIALTATKAVAEDAAKSASEVIAILVATDDAMRKTFERTINIGGYLEKIEGVFEHLRSGKLGIKDESQLLNTLTILEKMIRLFDPEFIMSEFRRKSDALAKKGNQKTTMQKTTTAPPKTIEAQISLGVIH